MCIRDRSSPIQAILPKTLYIDEYPLILQYQAFDDSYEFVTQGGTEVPVINGTIDPILELPAQMVRFHILNADDGENFTLNLSTGEDIIVIGTEGGLLPAPAYVSKLEITNGERYEIILDLAAYQGQTIYLQNTAPEGGGGPGGGGPGGGRMSATNTENMITLIISEPTTSAITTIPSALENFPSWSESEADITRQKILAGPGPNWTIDGVGYDRDVNNLEIPLDNIEIWEITNDSDQEHPFHIHDVQFYILDIDGIAPPDHKAGRKDVVQVLAGSTVRFITQFENFASDEFPYMYHCHILAHEASGMMGQFIVVEQ